MKKVFRLDFLGRDLIVETGELAKQTDGAVLVRYGDTVVLSVCVMGKEVPNQDFFPLQVLYQEKLYSVGKIPGGFIKREGRPSDAATLAARLIDRPIRPMFDENLRQEIQVVNTVLSVDPDKKYKFSQGTFREKINTDPEFRNFFKHTVLHYLKQIPTKRDIVASDTHVDTLLSDEDIYKV